MALYVRLLMLSHKARLYLLRSSAIVSRITHLPIKSLKVFHCLTERHRGTSLRITQSSSFLPLGTAINRGPLSLFPGGVVEEALRDFPS